MKNLQPDFHQSYNIFASIFTYKEFSINVLDRLVIKEPNTIDHIRETIISSLQDIIDQFRKYKETVL
jgi:hypothetical protein